jgi:hypothetical protein
MAIINTKQTTKLLQMKKTYLLLLIIAFVFSACKDVETIGSIKKVGSNTEYQSFVETENENVYLVGKSTIRQLNMQSVSNLNFQNLKFDSLEIEKIASGKKLNAFLTSKGLFFGSTIQNINLKKIENKTFTICDRIATLDSLILVQTGSNECQPDAKGELHMFKPDKALKANLVKSVPIENVVDWSVMNDLLWILYKNGALEVYTNKENKDLDLLSKTELKPVFHSIKPLPKLKKLIVYSDSGLIQLKLDDNNKIKLINEI